MSVLYSRWGKRHHFWMDQHHVDEVLAWTIDNFGPQGVGAVWFFIQKDERAPGIVIFNHDDAAFQFRLRWC